MDKETDSDAERVFLKTLSKNEGGTGLSIWCRKESKDLSSLFLNW